MMEMTMLKKKKVPVLRFPEFTKEDDYKKYSFQDIFIFSTGKNIKQKEASPEFEIPCVRYGELYHMYNEVIYKTINKTNLNREELLFSKGDEILLPSAGEDPLDIGSASALTLENVAIGRTINILRPKFVKLYSQIFVSYYINQQLKRNIARLAKGVSISNVYNSDLKKLEITLPNLLEQQKISNFLIAIDKKIQQLTQKKTLLETYKKGVMQKIFKQEIRFKDDKGEVYPDWEVKKLEDVAERVKRKNVENNSNVLTISAQQGLINQEKYFNKSVSAKNVTGYYLLHKDEFAYNKSYSKGYPMGAIKRLNNYEKGVLSTLYICFKIKEGNSKGFYEQYFESGFFNKQLQKIAQEGARNHGLLNMSIVEFFDSTYLPQPSFSEQKKIAECLNVFDEKIKKANKILEQHKIFKKGLLQKMFV